MKDAAQWVRRSRWSGELDLVQDGRVVAWFEGRGSRGMAHVDGVLYTLRRIRWPPFLTLRDAETDELIARFGWLAEFHDGTTFRYGWVRFRAREWSWADQWGETVLRSRRHWSWSKPLEFIAPAGSKWRLLAVLELASRELSIPVVK